VEAALAYAAAVVRNEVVVAARRSA